MLRGDVYKQLLAAVIDGYLGRSVVTNQFVIELKSYVAEQSKGKGERTLPPDKMTAKQACHILAMLADKVKFPTEDCIDHSMRVKMWRSRDLDKLATKVGQLPEEGGG